MSTFAEFNLTKPMVSALEKLGYLEPSPVQTSVIPKALRGQSLLCQSKTGSGKTHSYLVPLIAKVDHNLPRLQAIIVTPSRELARQVYDFAREFTRFFPKLKVRLCTSEAEKTQTSEGLSQAPQILVGTPGRLKDILIGEYALDLHGVRSLVLDEADMLMELGYFDDIDEVYRKLPEAIQVMAFSATLNESLKDHLGKYISADFLYEGEKDKTADDVSHHFVNIKHKGTLEALKSFIKIKNPYLMIVFASKKTDVDAIYRGLRAEKYSVVSFSGDLEMRERRKVIRMIKENHYQIIVASDLLSRGIDIEDVSDVVSLDLPNDLAYYYHRAGRTGRFGKKGDSWIFYNADSEARSLELVAQGTPFDYYTLKNDSIDVDPVGLAKKKKYFKKKAFSEEEATEVKIAKARSRSKTVKPGYKKKMLHEVEKVKNKYRRKAIKKSINRSKAKKYIEASKSMMDDED